MVGTDWWWWQLTASRSPSSPATREPGTVVTSTAPNSSPPGLWSLVADQVGRVLVEGAAGVDGHHLHAPADAEHRQPAASAASSSASSQASRSGRQPAVRGCGSAP